MYGTFCRSRFGAPDLITLRGKKISGGSGCCDLCRIPGQSAASRIYKENCEIYNSAKMTLEEVLDVIFAAEEKV